VSSWDAPEEYGGEDEVEAAPAGEEPSSDAEADGAQDTAEFDALPVLARGQVLTPTYEQVLTPTYYRAGGAQLARSPEGLLPAVHAAAAAAGGFVAGAAMVSFVRRRHRRALARRAGIPRRRGIRARKSPPRTGELLQVVASRSLLVDVHLLGGRE